MTDRVQIVDPALPEVGVLVLARVLDARPVAEARHEAEVGLAERAAGGQRREGVGAGAEAVVLADHDLHAGGVRRVHDLDGLRERLRERLLHEQVLLGAHGLHAEGGVAARRGDNHHGIRLHRLERLAQRAEAGVGAQARHFARVSERVLADVDECRGREARPGLLLLRRYQRDGPGAAAAHADVDQPERRHPELLGMCPVAVRVLRPC